ncbi:MAG: glyoxalase [Spirulina sp. SIO3F2]|nr:glyoxalase [Spirulina sp. SIO3F2]
MTAFNGTFHLAIPINDIAKAKAFYVEALGCSVGRESPQAMILNFGGHQVTTHMTPIPLTPQKGLYPRHFGLIFDEYAAWQACLERAQQHQLTFREQPRTRFAGQITEHSTFFLEDPFYNLLEFKHYAHPEAVFGAQSMAKVGDR